MSSGSFNLAGRDVTEDKHVWHELIYYELPVDLKISQEKRHVSVIEVRRSISTYWHYVMLTGLIDA